MSSSKRSCFSESDLRNMKIAGGSWFSLYRLQTAGGMREIFRRNSGNIQACKVLPLIVKKKQAKSCSLRGRCSLSRFSSVLQSRGLLDKANVPLLASDRPSTYFSGVNLCTNWLYELPGGVVEKGEKVRKAGVREMLEELGVKQKQVVAFTRLTGAMPYDSGSHAEFVSIVVALCYGDISPTSGEGIIPKECRCVPFRSLRKFVESARKRGIASEGHILSAAAQLCF